MCGEEVAATLGATMLGGLRRFWVATLSVSSSKVGKESEQLLSAS